MMHKATITTSSRNGSEVAKTLQVDNVEMTNLSVKTLAGEKSITTTIEADSIGALLATADDLLRCQIAAESMANQ
ncbi:MAG: KEOPS complex subunit Pcc1 [Candidatus Altiarchaeota archaeon]|nr:KEOPS complex subunit Pcc1 [Candidatus Altiarchaeota archaeon]